VADGKYVDAVDGRWRWRGTGWLDNVIVIRLRQVGVAGRQEGA
jgi:hypothetical protein